MERERQDARSERKKVQSQSAVADKRQRAEKITSVIPASEARPESIDCITGNSQNVKRQIRKMRDARKKRQT